MNKDIEDLINRHAGTYGVSPQLLSRIIQIESSGNPLATTGSYHGLMQLSPGEFSRWGGQGSIYDADANVRAGTAKLAGEIADFKARYGRDPTPTEAYLQHQQGVGGLAAHIANPDQPAWKSMYSTGEGREKGPDWARRAIWGNVPKDVRAQYPGGVENLTSQQFMDIWRRKVEGDAPVTPSPSGSQVAAAVPASLGAQAPASDSASSGILGGSVAAAEGTSAAEPPASNAASKLAAVLGELSKPQELAPIKWAAMPQPLPLAPPQLEPLSTPLPQLQQPLGWQIARAAALRGLKPTGIG